MEIKTTAIEKALRLLEAAGASFHVKLDDQEWGKALPNRVRKAAKYPFGSVRAYTKPYVENLKVNEAVGVPFGEFDPHSVYSSLTAYLTTKWGKGSYMVHKTKNQIEVLRLL